jgi:hypothetical protein
MAKLDQTLAVGAIRGRQGGVVYLHRKGVEGVNYVRTYTGAVANPRTVQQLRNRAVMRCCSGLWGTFSDAEKGYWNRQATGGQSGWNAFVSYNLTQAVDGWMPQLQRNVEHLSAPAAPTAATATVVDNAIVVTWTDAALAYTTGVHLGSAGGFTPAMSNCVYVTPATDGEDRQCTVLVAAGTYYLKLRSGDEDGGVGAPTVSVGPVVVT